MENSCCWLVTTLLVPVGPIRWERALFEVVAIHHHERGTHTHTPTEICVTVHQGTNGQIHHRETQTRRLTSLLCPSISCYCPSSLLLTWLYWLLSFSQTEFADVLRLNQRILKQIQMLAQGTVSLCRLS
jgi:hypothetical protein